MVEGLEMVEPPCTASLEQILPLKLRHEKTRKQYQYQTNMDIRTCVDNTLAWKSALFSSVLRLMPKI